MVYYGTCFLKCEDHQTCFRSREEVYCKTCKVPGEIDLNENNLTLERAFHLITSLQKLLSLCAVASK